jgi:hypothetical protein
MLDHLSAETRAKVLQMTGPELEQTILAVERQLSALRLVRQLRDVDQHVRSLLPRPPELRRAPIGLREWN